MEAHKVELLCNARLSLVCLSQFIRQFGQFCFESGPRESSVNGSHG